MRSIVICRHAKSDWNQGLPDFKRPLNTRGVKDAPMMGTLLNTYGWKPDLILASPAERTKMTAEAIARTFSEAPFIQWEEDIYYKGESELLTLIASTPSSIEKLMVVGHNSTLEDLCRYLLGQQGQLTLPTCGMVCIDFGIGSWKKIKQYTGTLRWFLIPRIVKGIF